MPLWTLLCPDTYTQSLLLILLVGIFGDNPPGCQSPICWAVVMNRRRLLPAFPLGTPAKMLDSVQQYRDRGYFTHSVKIGGDVCLDIERIRHLQKNRKPDEIIFYDLNRSWLPAEAIMVMNQLADFSVIFEQPCETLKQCLTVRKQTTQLISIDENLFTLDDMLFIIDRRVGEIVNIKISRVGGLTKARRLRDVALNAGIKFIIMDTGGGVIADTATQHFAWTIPPAFRIATWLCQDMLAVDVVDFGKGRQKPKRPCSNTGKLRGLGRPTQRKNAGKPVAVYL